ncbi:MAG: hypothetical protein OQK00_01275 [Rhodobacteraceae bacterium]|nr:hypothetical protein [Paracoccaceae bacterium]MCW9044297.1 hypothetical protein [Pseudopelagicola sp.]
MSTYGAKRVRLGLLLVCTVAIVAGCANLRDRVSRSERVTFDGLYFPASVDRIDRDNRDHIKVYVQKPRQSLKAAREAGRFEAVKYCIKEYGTSQIDWINGPDVEDAALVFDRERLVFEGKCNP